MLRIYEKHPPFACMYINEKFCVNSRKFRVISRTLLVYSRIFFLYENEPNIDFRSNEFGRTQLIFQRIQNIFVLQTAYVRGAISKCSYIMSIKLLRAHHIYKRHIVQVIRMYTFHLWKKVLFFGKQWHSWPGGGGGGVNNNNVPLPISKEFQL